jgi:murein DD-endopeptidase MepM/ murein hydrolase activator NlpD
LRVITTAGSTRSSLYGHLNPTISVREGDSVVAGQVVGLVGLTGHTTGPHLHFAIYTSGVPVDPLLILPVRP